MFYSAFNVFSIAILLFVSPLIPLPHPVGSGQAQSTSSTIYSNDCLNRLPFFMLGAVFSRHSFSCPCCFDVDSMMPCSVNTQQSHAEVKRRLFLVVFIFFSARLECPFKWFCFRVHFQHSMRTNRVIFHSYQPSSYRQKTMRKPRMFGSFEWGGCERESTWKTRKNCIYQSTNCAVSYKKLLDEEKNENFPRKSKPVGHRMIKSLQITREKQLEKTYPNMDSQPNATNA